MRRARMGATMSLLVAVCAVAILAGVVTAVPVLGQDGGQQPHPAGRWVLVPSPNVGRLTNVADSVSFAGRSDGWLVGAYLTKVRGGTAFRTLTERWNGHVWSIVPSGDPGIDNVLTGVVALGSDDAWAVGWSTEIDRTGGSISVPLIEHWNGSRWLVVRAPDIGAETGTLAAIAADRDGRLWAVGSRTLRVGTRERALVLLYSMGGWRFVPAQDPRGRYTRLTSVAPAGADVWAVGLTLDRSGDEPNATLIERLGPGGGRIVRSPNPWRDGNELYGVAARGPNDIWAVGDGMRGVSSVPLTIHYDGRSWRSVRSPRPGPSSMLLGVARTSGRTFWAVGFSAVEAIRSPVAERWTGSRWVVVSTPAPHPYGNWLSAVATMPGWRSMAVGSGIGRSGYQRTLVMVDRRMGR